MKNIIVFFFSLLLFYAGFSQAKARMQVSGKVTDSRTNEPLTGASVSIEDAKLATVTDSAGNFIFRNVPGGHHLVEVSYTGYGSVLEHLDLIADRELNISLVSSIIEYQAVTITGVSTSTSVRK